MKKTTHIAALTELATKLHDSSGSQRNNTNPLNALAGLLELSVDSYQFIRVLTWIIAFYHEGVEIVSTSSLSEKNKAAALANIRALFQPLLPPFQGQVQQWFSSAMSQTNQSYFDLLSDSIEKVSPIYLPDQEKIEEYKSQLTSILFEIDEIGLPKWIGDDFRESVALVLKAIEKIPFLAYKIIQDANNNILARLFSVANADQKRFMVKVATTMNIIFAAFVMPHEAAEAGHAYYDWMLESSISQEQITACAAPLALPAPSVHQL